jgi:hypothetical protein
MTVLADSVPIWVTLTTSAVAAAASIFAVLWARGTSTRVAELSSELEEERTARITELASKLEEERTARIAELDSRLEEGRSAHAALLDYQYEARKRLYAEAEPLLFQALELAEEARSRIESLARTARLGYLRPDGAGWLAAPGYYYKSTAYILLAPITSYKVLQRRLTTIDLGLEPRMATQYELLKLIFLSFTNDFDLARAAGLPYRPDEADPGQPRRDELLRDSPATYRRQGLYRGIVEMLSEALIVSEGEHARCKSLGEFWGELPDPETRVGRQAGEIDALLRGFHPLTLPVLWRVLVAQHRLYDVFLATKRSESGTAVLGGPTDEDFERLDWRRDGAGASDDDVRAVVSDADAFVAALVQKSVRAARRTPAAR